MTCSQILGPVVVHTQPPVFQPPVAVSLKEQLVVAEWGDGAFTDTKQDYLHYSFAIGKIRLMCDSCEMINFIKGFQIHSEIANSPPNI